MSRRHLLVAGAATLVLAACGDDGDGADQAASSLTSPGDPSTTTSAAAGGSSTTISAGTGLTAADFAALGTCMLLPKKNAGPFPLDEQLDRRDITEGYDGHPVRLGL